MDFAGLQRELPAAWEANRAGSRVDHALVALPSFSLGETILSHYAARIPALEHRYLLSTTMLPRVPGCELIFLSCATPPPEVLGYYAGLWPGESRAATGRRFKVVTVPDMSARAVSAKLLDRPDILERVRRMIGDRPAMIEPWNVTEDEVKLALSLGIPVNGTAPDLWPLGFKSEGRRIFQRAGVPVPLGQEDVHDLAEIRAALEHIRDRHPRAAGVVVKHDNSAAGDGNLVIRLDGDVESKLAAIPGWYLQDLTRGGVVEELIAGDDFASPSAQLDITPHGAVQVLSTHEQLLGGPDNQVYLGCSFPAASAYAADLARHARAVGEELARRGVVGRVGIDFVAVRSGGSWDVRALEMNLRKGGTTHPFTTLRHLVPGRYDEGGGVWRADTGGERCYRATDNLVDESWLGLPPRAVIEAVETAGLAFDPVTGTGVVLHMLTCLTVDGRMGLTAIGRDGGEADELVEATRQAVTASAAAS